MTKSHTRLIFLAFIVALGSSKADDPVPTVTRQPYLQMATPTQMTIRWRTDIVTQGRVRFGTVSGALTQNVTETLPAVVDHSVKLTGLTPGTKYFYAIDADGTEMAGGAEYYFTTPNAVGATAPLRFWALGDAGTANSGQISVVNAFRPLHAVKPADLILLLGDNAYSSGLDYQYQAAVFDIYQPFLKQVPLWSCIGNHETYGGLVEGSFAYDKIFEFPTAGECGGVASGTERYYSWNQGNVHFVSLDSMTSDRASDGPMAQWLMSDLQANTQPWTVAFFHHPPYTRGSHDSDYEGELIQMRQNILPILEDYGVDLVLGGHSHCYERSFLLNGHYGASTTLSAIHKVDGGDGRIDGTGRYMKSTESGGAHKGAVYVVAGSSGQISGGQLNHPAHFISLNQLGSLVVDVSDKQMDVKFLRENTDPETIPPTYDDHFTITKFSPQLPVAPTGLIALSVTGTETMLHWEDQSSSETQQLVLLTPDGGNEVVAVTLGHDLNGTVLTGLTAGVAYSVRVRSLNALGEATSDPLTFVQAIAPSATTPIQRWRFVQWGSILGDGARADAADADNDGFQNLLEYALGTSPRRAISYPQLAGVMGPNGNLRFSFHRQLAPDLRYIVEFSSELSEENWTEAFNSTGLANVAGTVTVDDPSAQPPSRRFARLRVDLQ